jgi:flavin-dependent dehydrogenase
VAVIGGGPSGSFFSYFLLEAARRFGLQLEVDLYEPKEFSRPGPAGCNMCGGIISESLVQNLAAEGIILPPTVVQRGIDSYVLHLDVGSVKIATPLGEKRIASVYRGGGPRQVEETGWLSFDAFLLSLAVERGARRIADRIEEVCIRDRRPAVRTASGPFLPYDLVAVASGVNSATLHLFEPLGLHYRSPRTTKTNIREYCFDAATLARRLGSSMHVFLPNIPRLEFAAVIPKGRFASFCLLGREIDPNLLRQLTGCQEVKRCMPEGWDPEAQSCKCAPKMNVGAAIRPYGDRVVFVGDAGVTRLYKDGIGAAYRTAKAAATTAVFEGVSASALRKFYWPACRAIERDNRIGRLLFTATRIVQKSRLARRVMLQVVIREQENAARPRHLSTILWDMFTGSASYGEILGRALNPGLWLALLRALATSTREVEPRPATGLPRQPAP